MRRTPGVGVCGIDEAGRGSMVGPLVVAAVSVRRSRLGELARMGVRDSKELSPAARERLYPLILGVADAHAVLRAPARSVDASVRRRGLNGLEARYMARAAARLGAATTYVDSCDVDAARFGRKVSEMAGGLRVVSRHRADSRFVAVAAASVVAKVERDRSLARIRRSHDVGSGYPSDPAARRFVELRARRGALPPFVRRSWRPVRRLTGA